jgi:MFS family permease
MCLAQVLAILGFSTFQALIPVFQAEWGISNTGAGWISGIYFAGYVGAVPLLSSLTDRLDPKKIILYSLALGGASSLAFAAADGFWSALLFRLLQGVGLAGTYMPGLKALSDHIEGPKQSRYVSFYTASFGIGAALSFVLAGAITPAFGWGWAFAANAIGAALAAAVIAGVLPSSVPSGGKAETHILDFREVMSNREALRYILAYCGHNWELFAFRAWAVPFLLFALSRHPGSDFGVDVTIIAATLTLFGVPASVFGNELALRFGRRRTIVAVLIASVALSLVLGASAGVSYGLVVGLSLLYGVLLTGDSGAITAGTVAAAAPGMRGATLAMHAFIGFIGGIFGPLAIGVVLDVMGADTVLGWGVAIAVIGAGSVFALAAMVFVGRGRR